MIQSTSRLEESIASNIEDIVSPGNPESHSFLTSNHT
jgi:hypothetical protein